MFLCYKFEVSCIIAKQYNKTKTKLKYFLGTGLKETKQCSEKQNHNSLHHEAGHECRYKCLQFGSENLVFFTFFKGQGKWDPYCFGHEVEGNKITLPWIITCQGLETIFWLQVQG